jgi:hypothetical protein
LQLIAIIKQINKAMRNACIGISCLVIFLMK